MKTFTFPKLLVLLTAALMLSTAALAQAVPADDARSEPGGRKAGPRPNLLRELGLSREQVQSMRLINQERKPAETAARKRFQEANRGLNMAIYDDNIDENQFKARLSEFQAAQAELARIKFSNELAVRKILTPAQLARFRELRRQFAEERQEMRDAGLAPNGDPVFRRQRRNQRRPIN